MKAIPPPSWKDSRMSRMQATLRKTKSLIRRHGDKAALEAIRWLVGEKPLAHVAKEAGMTRSDLHVILTVTRGKIMHKKRRALEPALNLLPGGLGVILAVVEDHIAKEVENGSA